MTLEVKIAAFVALLLFAAVSRAEQAKNVKAQYRHPVIADNAYLPFH